MEISNVIAINLKKLRLERNLSLGQLSEISGVSKVMLSQIEKGESNPTINTIWKIVSGLKVPYTSLIDEVKNDTVVVRKSETVDQQGDTDGYKIHCYFKTNPTRNFELFHGELEAFTENESNAHSEKSEEYILVTKGQLIIKIGEMEYILEQGDAIFFDAVRTHTYINRKNMLSQFIIINYYP